jgi:NAD+-dependent secondary alcohol dehydrogenase Adh1
MRAVQLQKRGAIEDGAARLDLTDGHGAEAVIDFADIISTELNFIGNLVGSYNDLAELMVLAARGQVSLHTSAYRLTDLGKALEDLDGGRVRGRAILVPQLPSR